MTDPTGEEQVVKRQPPLAKPVAKSQDKPVKRLNKKRPRLLDDDDEAYVRIGEEETDSQKKKKQKLNYDAPRASQVPNISKEPLNLSLEAGDISDGVALSQELNNNDHTVMMIAETPTPVRPVLIVPDTNDKVGTPAIKLDPEMEALLSNMQSDQQVKSEMKVSSLSIQFGAAISPVVSPMHKESEVTTDAGVQPKRLSFDEDNDVTMEEAQQKPKKILDKDDEEDMLIIAETIASICPIREEARESAAIFVNNATSAMDQTTNDLLANIIMLKRNCTGMNVSNISLSQLLQAQEDCLSILKWVHDTMTIKCTTNK